MKACGRGTTFQLKMNKRSTIPVQIGYKRVRSWTSGRATPYRILQITPRGSDAHALGQSDAIFVFLSKIKLDIVPDKGWQSEDMFVPPGYHLDSKITDDAGSPKEPEQAAFTYPAGLGNVLMNGCYGTGYKEGDPCYVAKWTLDACLVSKQADQIIERKQRKLYILHTESHSSEVKEPVGFSGLGQSPVSVA